MHSLLNLMHGVYGPQLMGNNSWPDSTKKELTGQYHKFMASLTETAHQALGKTVLYLPNENFDDVNKAAKDKDFVQQLESIVIYWTRQIKEVVNHHDNADIAEVSGPLEEIDFWRSRTVDLSGISEQLQRPDVKKVSICTSQLTHTSSLHLWEGGRKLDACNHLIRWMSIEN